MLPPEVIRDALIDEERARFEVAYREALAEDPSRVLDVLGNYDRIARLTLRQGPQEHRRMLDKAAEIVRTGRNPTGVGIEDVRALINERLARLDPIEFTGSGHDG